jgi:hypothetical protein
MLFGKLHLGFIEGQDAQMGLVVSEVKREDGQQTVPFISCNLRTAQKTNKISRTTKLITALPQGMKHKRNFTPECR